MTYGQHPTCRRAGCGHPALTLDPKTPDDEFCPEHADEVRLARVELTVNGHPLGGQPGLRPARSKQPAA